MLHAASLLVCIIFFCLRVQKAQNAPAAQHRDGPTPNCLPVEEEDDDEGALLQTALESSAKSDRRVGQTIPHKTTGTEEMSVVTNGGNSSHQKLNEVSAKNAGNVPVASVKSQIPHLPSFPLPIFMLSVSSQATYLQLQTYGLMAFCVLSLMMALAIGYYQRKTAVPAKADAAEVPSYPQPVEPPSPAPRLAKCGTSFVIPHVRISSCRAAFLNFDVPAWPVVWPFQVVLRRPTEGLGPWVMLEITTDAITAAGLPPILSCKRAGNVQVALEDGFLTEIGVFDGANVMVATIKPDTAGTCFRVHREGCSELDVYVEFVGGNPRVTVGKQGREVALATSIGPSTHRAVVLGNEEYLQLDVQPESQSSEAAFLLACVLAVLALRPNQQSGPS